MVTKVYPNGQADVTVAAGESIAVLSEAAKARGSKKRKLPRRSK